MPFREQYQAQVRLLMRLIPIVARNVLCSQGRYGDQSVRAGFAAPVRRYRPYVFAYARKVRGIGRN